MNLDLKKINLYYYPNERALNNELLYYEALESHLDKYREVPVSAGLAYQYQGDFFGLLEKLKVDNKYFYATMYLNGLMTPYDFDGEETTLKIAQPINLPTR